MNPSKEWFKPANFAGGGPGLGQISAVDDGFEFLDRFAVFFRPATQDFFFPVPAELRGGLEGFFPAGIVVMVKLFHLTDIGLGRPENAEAGHLFTLPCAGISF